eukprot:4143187-Amphidinium_carterae.1
MQGQMVEETHHTPAIVKVGARELMSIERSETREEACSTRLAVKALANSSWEGHHQVPTSSSGPWLGLLGTSLFCATTGLPNSVQLPQLPPRSMLMQQCWGATCKSGAHKGSRHAPCNILSLSKLRNGQNRRLRGSAAHQGEVRAIGVDAKQGRRRRFAAHCGVQSPCDTTMQPQLTVNHTKE